MGFQTQKKRLFFLHEVQKQEPLTQFFENPFQWQQVASGSVRQRDNCSISVLDMGDT